MYEWYQWLFIIIVPVFSVIYIINYLINGEDED